MGGSDECAVGRSGEAPCWQTLSFSASPFSSIYTMAAWPNGRPWRWTYSRDVSRGARVSPRVLSGISTSLMCQFAANALGDRIRVVRHWCRRWRWSLPVLEQEKMRRRWVQALTSVRRYPPMAQQADSQLQLPQVSRAPLDGAT